MTSSAVFHLLERMAQEPGKKAKEDLLRSHSSANSGDDTLRRVLDAALNPFHTYGLASLASRRGDGHLDFDERHWQLLERLRSRELSGNDARAAVQQAFDELNAASAELLRRIITKDLRAGFAENTVNKVFPGLVPDFAYMRCSLPKEVDLSSWPWQQGVFSQEKADGMFANVDVESGAQVRVTSRQGSALPLQAMGALAEELVSVLRPGFQYHGELLVQQRDDEWTTLSREVSNGALNSILKGGQLGAAQRVLFVAWDRVPLHAVRPKGRHDEPYAERLAQLGDVLSPVDARDCGLTLVPTRVVTSLQEAYAHYRELLALRKEGTIVKHPEALWRDGTSKEQVKLKLEVDCDLEIVDFVPGNGKNAALFGSIRCRSSCAQLQVDVSGFSDALRRQLHQQRQELLGAIVTVKANALMSPSREGGLHSLFLPRFVEIRHDKREADSLQRIRDQFESAIQG